jgi:hypothetical protein
VVATLRGSLFGIAAPARAIEAKRRIDDALLSGGELAVGTHDRSEGTMVQLDGAMMFPIIPADTLENSLPAARADAQRAAALLQQAIEESRESRDTRSLRAGGALLATVVAGALWWAMRRLHRRLGSWIVGRRWFMPTGCVGGVELVRRGWCARAALLDLVFWLVVLLLPTSG